MSAGKQPEALRLADVLNSDFDPDWMLEIGYDQIERELRRLHEVNAELLHVALMYMAWVKDCIRDQGMAAIEDKARAAIAKAGSAS